MLVYCYTKFASTTYDVEILIVLQLYLLHKNAHNLQVRTKKMLLRTKTSKIMHLIHFSTVMLQSHYTCQKTNDIKLYINYIFLIVDIDFSRADLISLLVSF